jgi:hypothetical protein
MKHLMGPRAHLVFGVCRLQYKAGILSPSRPVKPVQVCQNRRSKAFVFVNANANLSIPNLSNRIIGSLQVLTTKLSQLSIPSVNAKRVCSSTSKGFFQTAILHYYQGTSSTTHPRLPTLKQPHQTCLPSSRLLLKR